MAKRILSKGRFWIRRQVRRFQRWLGLPPLSCRATLLILLALLGLAYVSLALFDKIMTEAGQYASQPDGSGNFDRDRN